MEIGASDAPASCGSSVLSLCRLQARGARGLESTERWTNLALGYVSYDVYMRKFTRKRHFARAPRRRRAVSPPQGLRPLVLAQ